MGKTSREKHHPPGYTVGEDIANSVTHGIGAILSLVGVALLLYRASTTGTALHWVSFSIYGLSLFLLHISSTLYHAIRHPGARRVFWVFDHCSIYLLIAGTYTPFLLLSLWGKWGLTLLVVIWTLAILGIVMKSVFIGRFRGISLVVYLLMGWMIVLAAREVWFRVPHRALVYVAVGGAFYTLGTIFFGWKRLPYNHAIWHLFVLGGSVSHYLGILFYLTPGP
jgi:hemolysin III